MPADRRATDPEGPQGATAQELEAAYRNATRTATRSSLLGAVGFGVALLMLALVAGRGPSPSPTPVSFEHMLAFGGAFGGLVFTAIATRASRTAKSCRRLLDELD